MLYNKVGDETSFGGANTGNTSSINTGLTSADLQRNTWTSFSIISDLDSNTLSVYVNGSLAEHMTVNHGVLGSSPCSGADARGLRKGSFKKRLQGVVRKRVVRRVIGRLPLQSQAIFRGA